jgi:anti-sigma regulatory factor (Ser/Thr protein kinase)
MKNITMTSVRVDGPDQAAEARRCALGLAARLEFDDTTSGRAALVVTECANNLWKHAGGGEVLLGSARSGSETGLQILALDKGPGMHDPARCYEDGYSTAGSPGTGLGAIRRLSTEHDLYTVPGKGTALVSRVRAPRREGNGPVRAPLEAAGVSVPMRGEDECGDAFAVHQGPDYGVALVVDGIGHGPDAARCAAAATETFSDVLGQEPAAILVALHRSLRATRGAAAAVARFDFIRREIRFAGVGNIAGVCYSNGDARHMTSMPGIVGQDTKPVREFAYAWPPNALVLLYSDGISTHWSLNSYEGLVSRDLAIISGVLYRDWNRGRDDATVLGIRESAAP